MEVCCSVHSAGLESRLAYCAVDRALSYSFQWHHCLYGVHGRGHGAPAPSLSLCLDPNAKPNPNGNTKGLVEGASQTGELQTPQSHHSQYAVYEQTEDNGGNNRH